MTTSVLERKREIGIMKAIGARNEQIFYQFLIESGLLGLAGGTIGILLGTGIGYLGTLALEYLPWCFNAAANQLVAFIFGRFGQFFDWNYIWIGPCLKSS